MDADVANADCRLDAWASWVRQNRGAWPANTLLGRIIEQGISGAAQAGSVENMPEHVAETDRAVAHIDRRLQQIVKIYYLMHAASEVKAARCGVSRATFWRLVTRGQKAVWRELNIYSIQGETEDRYSSASLRMVSSTIR
jgi:hypothetical protein